MKSFAERYYDAYQKVMSTLLAYAKSSTMDEYEKTFVEYHAALSNLRDVKEKG